MYHREKWNTFFGAREAVANFQEGKAINVLVDWEYSMQRFVLINSLTKTQHLEYKTEDEAFALLSDNMVVSGYVFCSYFFSYHHYFCIF